MGEIREKILTWPKPDKEHLILTSSQIEDFEAEIFARGMPVGALMEKVGLGMRDWILKNADLIAEGVVFLIGPGHNGGDGLVLARELYLAGKSVSLWCPFALKKELTKTHFSYCKSLGIEILKTPPDVQNNNLWIDALFGVGQSRAIPKEIELLLEARQDKKPGRLISLDVPSGVCADTGKLLSSVAATALFTLTVGVVKQGLLQDVALPFVGKLIRIDIGLPEKVLSFASFNSPLRLTSKDLDTAPLPHPLSNLDKYNRGRTLVVAGSNKYRGASLLALQGALASGVGSINAVLPKIVADSLWQVLPEVVIQGLSKTSSNDEVLLRESLLDIDFSNFDSLLIGPGLGLCDEAWSGFAEILSDFYGLLILDADALNRLAKSSENWRWLLKRKGPTWLTPHKKEFERLFPDLISLTSLEAATEAAKRSKAVVLLKGANSVVADPFGRKWQLSQTASYSARTGLGDVLAGFLAGIGAAGISSSNELKSEFFAAAVLLHAEAAKKCPYGTNAGSIATFLGQIRKDFQTKKCLQRNI